MTWADGEVEKVEKERYALRDRAKSSHPEFVELADRVLRNLEDGIRKLKCTWRLCGDPGLYLSASQELYRSQNGKYFRVVVDYPNRSFVVDSRSHPNWRNFTRTVTPSFAGKASEEQVDQIAAEIVGTFLPHFTSPTYILKGGLSKEQEAELDKDGQYDDASPKP